MNHSISPTNRQRNVSVSGLRTLAVLAGCWMILVTTGQAAAQRVPASGMMAASVSGIFGDHHQKHEPGYWGYRPTEYEMIPANTGWAKRSPVDKVLGKAFANTWVRLDYLNWDIREPGDKFLGAPLGQFSNLEDPFPAVDARSGLATPFAVVPSLESVNLNNQDGLRGTLGIELMHGSLEANIWYLEESNTGVSGAEAFGQGFFPVTSILQNGNPQTAATPNVIVYDTAFNAELETNTMGSEINYIVGSEYPNELIQLRPTFGIRYVQFNEKLTQVGVNTLTTTARTSVIESNANNDLFGPQAGIRIEMVHDRIKLGIHPGFVFGFNRHSARVKTVRLFSPISPTIVSGERHSEVAPMISLNAYAELTVSDRFKLFAGYDLLWMNKVSRPYENIFYNDNGIGSPPGVLVNVQLNDLLIQGMSFGGVLTF